ncbi:MAG: hypothetical protein ACLRZ9_09400 [Eubacterium sp.]
MIEKSINKNVTSKYKIFKLYEMPKFTGKNVPVKDAAKLMGKDQQFIRQGIIKGILPIGIAFKKTIVDTKWNETKESTQYDFYISPKLLWEYTGIIYNEDTDVN